MTEQYQPRNINFPLMPTLVSANTTLNLDDELVIITAGAPVITLPDARVIPSKQIALKSTPGTGSVTGQAGQTIDGLPIVTFASPQDAFIVESDGQNWQVLSSFGGVLAPTWTEVLVAGSDSGGTDPVLSGGDSLQLEGPLGGSLGRVGPDPLLPNSYSGFNMPFGDYNISATAGDQSTYVNFYNGTRIAYGDLTNPQEIEFVLSLIRFFASFAFTSEMRLTPPAAAGNYWRFTFGTDALGIDFNKQIALTGVITPAALGVGPTQNYNPASLVNATVIRQDMSAVGSVGGLAGGVDGRILTWHNISAANSVTFNHLDGGSDADKQFLLPFNAALLVGPNDSLAFRYDGTSTKWRTLTWG